MNPGFRFTLDQASAAAPEYDALYYFIWAVTAFFTVLVFGLILFLSFRYRRRSEDERPQPTVESTKLELFYSVVPFMLTMVIFLWGVKTYLNVYGEAKDPLDVHVIGKQWMWKIQHPDGKREIDELHVPTGRDVQLTMSSQDVIHSFFIPAFRAKMDVVPGKYTKFHFVPTKVGEYHLFCAEYCGTQHSGMIGKVVVMKPEDYEAWLRGTTNDAAPAQAGAKLFTSLGCQTCHGAYAPTMVGLYGSQRKVRSNNAGAVYTVTADDQYLRESILESTKKVVDGYTPIMPSFRGQISEDQLMALIAYIKGVQKGTIGQSGVVPAAPDQLNIVEPPPIEPKNPLEFP